MVKEDKVRWRLPKAEEFYFQLHIYLYCSMICMVIVLIITLMTNNVGIFN